MYKHRHDESFAYGKREFISPGSSDPGLNHDVYACGGEGGRGRRDGEQLLTRRCVGGPVRGLRFPPTTTARGNEMRRSGFVGIRTTGYGQKRHRKVCHICNYYTQQRRKGTKDDRGSNEMCKKT